MQSKSEIQCCKCQTVKLLRRRAGYNKTQRRRVGYNKTQRSGSNAQQPQRSAAQADIAAGKCARRERRRAAHAILTAFASPRGSLVKNRGTGWIQAPKELNERKMQCCTTLSAIQKRITKDVNNSGSQRHTMWTRRLGGSPADSQRKCANFYRN